MQPRDIWPRDEPAFNHGAGSHFVSVSPNRRVACMAISSARLPLSADTDCDYFPRSFFSNAWSFHCHRSDTNHKRRQRSSACACVLTMNPTFLNSTPLTCHSATEVMLIRQPNAVAKPSLSALHVEMCVCLRVCERYDEFRD